MPFENLLQDFIVNLGVGVNWGTTGNMQLFLGNPGDYAWGREGLDAIVTQLLNQMDSTGKLAIITYGLLFIRLLLIVASYYLKKLG